MAVNLPQEVINRIYQVVDKELDKNVFSRVCKKFSEAYMVSRYEHVKVRRGGRFDEIMRRRSYCKYVKVLQFMSPLNICCNTDFTYMEFPNLKEVIIGTKICPCASKLIKNVSRFSATLTWEEGMDRVMKLLSANHLRSVSIKAGNEFWKSFRFESLGEFPNLEHIQLSSSIRLLPAQHVNMGLNGSLALKKLKSLKVDYAFKLHWLDELESLTDLEFIANEGDIQGELEHLEQIQKLKVTLAASKPGNLVTRILNHGKNLTDLDCIFYCGSNNNMSMKIDTKALPFMKNLKSLNVGYMTSFGQIFPSKISPSSSHTLIASPANFANLVKLAPNLCTLSFPYSSNSTDDNDPLIFIIHNLEYLTQLCCYDAKIINFIRNDCQSMRIPFNIENVSTVYKCKQQAKRRRLY